MNKKQQQKLENHEWMRLVYLQIGSNVKKYRQQKGLSQVALAHEMGHESVGAVSTSEIGLNGKHFNIEHLAKIAHILEVDICNFFEGIDQINH